MICYTFIFVFKNVNVPVIVCTDCLCVYMLIFVEDANRDSIGEKGFSYILIFQ